MVIDVCDDMLEFLYTTKNMTDDQFFDICVREKTSSLLERNGQQFNDLLNKLDSGIDYSDSTQVKKCITKLIRMSSRNRANFRSILRRMEL